MGEGEISPFGLFRLLAKENASRFLLLRSLHRTPADFVLQNRGDIAALLRLLDKNVNTFIFAALRRWSDVKSYENLFSI